MVRKAKGKHRLDKYYHLAKEQGYRSRAAFKLVQLNRQFHFLDTATSCLDLCAAPGGWMQVCVKTMPLNSLVIGIDLDAIKPIKGAKGIVGDITTSQARAAIKRETGGRLVDVVLHDGAPNVGGVWASEAYGQSTLVVQALRLATDTLRPDGVFVTKVFRSQDYNSLLFVLNQLFAKVDATKPPASRNTSAEIFVVCRGYKAPSKIDPRLLDPKHLFKEVAEAPRPMGPDALIKQKIKQKRFREGYEDGLSAVQKTASAAAFVASDGPVEMLGQYTRFTLDDAAPAEGGPAVPEGLAAFIQAHPGTDTEVRTLLGDLQVLGRSEFKALLKWRLKVKRDFAIASKAAAGEDSDADEAGGAAEADPEAALLAEMEEVRAGVSQREKRERKKRLRMKRRARVRSAQLAMAEGIVEDDAQEPLFSLAAIQAKARADDLNEAEAPAEDAAESSEGSGSEPESDIDSEEEARRREAAVEEYLEEAYQQYKARKGKRAAAEERAAAAKRARLGDGGDLPSDAEMGGSDGEAEAEAPPAEAPEFEEVPAPGAGLLVPLGQGPRPPKSAAALAAQWFSQDLFAEEAGPAAADASAAAEAPAAAAEPAAAAAPAKAGGKGKRAAAGASGAAAAAAPPQAVEAPGFEVVPAAASASDSDSEPEAGPQSDSEPEEPDARTAAELRALAKAMLRGRRKADILDAAYNRYNQHDSGLPSWFADDQARHMQPAPVVSEAEIEAERQRFKAINARPIKKVAEAKARKKKRLQARLEAARKKAGAVLQQEELSERAKAKEVEKLYAQAKAGKGRGKKKPSRSDKFKRKGPPLDRRLLSDKRQVRGKAKAKAAKAAKRKGKAKGKGGGGGKAKGAAAAKA